MTPHRFAAAANSYFSYRFYGFTPGTAVARARE